MLLGCCFGVQSGFVIPQVRVVLVAVVLPVIASSLKGASQRESCVCGKLAGTQGTDFQFIMPFVNKRRKNKNKTLKFCLSQI